jgi:copper transport protein
MTSYALALRRGAIAAVLAALLGMAFASPAAAHTELVGSSPANGARLDSAPAEVRLTFTESVNLIDGGLRLLDRAGATVPTADPKVAGHTVTWPMPRNLSDGPYVASWRVVSADGHPVAGAFSFGVGADAVPVAGDSTGSGGSSASTAPFPVVAARLGGYLGFACLAGVIAFVLWCSVGAASDPSLQRAARLGLIGGVVAGVVGLLLQGPYTAGRPFTALLDPRLLGETLSTPFGLAMLWRLVLYGVLAGLAWHLPTVTRGTPRWLVPTCIVGVAVTIAGAGHGASGRWTDLAVVTAHVLTAGVWVGGLVVLTILGRAVERRALAQFSRLAMASVLVLVTTGVVNSLQRVHSVDQLFFTRYGVLLWFKLILVAVALAGAAISRHRLAHQGNPLSSVRAEAMTTVVVLAVTAALSMTTPPPTAAAAQERPAAAVGPSTRDNRQVQMPLGEGRSAMLAVLPATTTGSRLRLQLTRQDGTLLDATAVRLDLSNPGRGIGAIPVPMVERDGFWAARYRFPLSGTWKARVTVQERDLGAVVTGGDIAVIE